MTDITGKLIVKIIEAKLNRDIEWFGQMNPYCIIKCGNDTQQIEPDINAGKMPCWNQTVNIFRHDEITICVEVWDYKQILSDEYIAECTIPIDKALKTGCSTEWYDLTYKENYSGRIHIELIWIPSDVDQLPNARLNLTLSVNPPDEPYGPYINPADYIDPLENLETTEYPGPYV